jgi:hypothetical protein
MNFFTKTRRNGMTRIKTGFLSGLLATYVAGSMLLMNNALHSFPEVRFARTLAEVLGTPGNVMVGVAVILITGIFVFGALFAVLAPRLPMQMYLTKSLAFAVTSWVLMMVLFMPLAGAGFFGLERSPVVPVGTLVLNLAYWLVLGMSYRWLVGPAAASTQN